MDANSATNALKQFNVRLRESVIDRIKQEAENRNLSTADYTRNLIHDALTKDPGQEIDELRRTVVELQEQIAYMTDSMQRAYEALLITIASDSSGHKKDRIPAVMEVVFPKR